MGLAPPIFVLHYHKVIPCPFEKVQKFIHMKTKYQKYAITEHPNLYWNMFAMGGIDPNRIAMKKTNKSMKKLVLAAERKFNLKRFVDGKILEMEKSQDASSNMV